jgi:hypothetical protein
LGAKSSAQMARVICNQKIIKLVRQIRCANLLIGTLSSIIKATPVNIEKNVIYFNLIVCFSLFIMELCGSKSAFKIH